MHSSLPISTHKLQDTKASYNIRNTNHQHTKHNHECVSADKQTMHTTALHNDVTKQEATNATKIAVNNTTKATHATG